MSKWDKLLNRILSLSADIRFEELKRSLSHMDITNTPLEEEVVITPSEKMDITP